MNDPDQKPAAQSTRPKNIVIGFCAAVGVFGLAYLIPPDRQIGRVAPYLLAVTLLPLSAIIFAIIPSTRKFGLGMLLGCGIVWLAMLAICGGTFR